MADVLILGGGFAGMAALRELARGPAAVNVRLIDEGPVTVFTPLLPDVISGRVRPLHMVHPLEPACRRLGAEFVQATVEWIDAERLAVGTTAGEFAADVLLICLGCRNNYFGDEEASRRAIGLKTIEEGFSIRQRALHLLERARARSAGALPHAIVVGGGYTGIEVASHIAHLLHQRSGRPYGELRELCPVLILEKASRPLRNVSARVREWALQLVERFGVELRTECTVESFSDGEVRLSDGSRLEHPLVAWCAGVTPGRPVAEMGPPTVRQGRLKVDNFLRVAGASNVLAAGDVAGAALPGEDGLLRLAVQFSVAQGRCAGRNALRLLAGRSLRAFRATDLGYVLPLAPGQAAGVVLGRELAGRLPSWAQYAACCLRARSWRNRLGLLFDLLAGDADERWSSS